MSTMVESQHLYSSLSTRSHHHGQDLTPYSAVSSFNLPAHYDSSLITPVSMTQSPSVPTKSAPMLRGDPDIKLSPSLSAPNYQLFCNDDDFAHPRFNNPPMKLKDPSGTLQISTADKDISFPQSPFLCSSPYYGAFGVSATSQSGRTTESLQNPNQSPLLSSSGGSNNENLRSPHTNHAQNSNAFRASSQAPILIAPNPLSLRPATTLESNSYRQGSLHSNQSTPRSQGPAQGQFQELQSNSLPPRHKRKTPPTEDLDTDIILDGKASTEEKLLLELDHQGFSWKEIATKFNERTGKEMKVPALQMRKKRLRERLRKWTDADERALTTAWEQYEKGKWQTIANNMQRHGGSREKWSKEACEKKWSEMHPDDAPVLSEYELLTRNANQQMAHDMMQHQRACSSSWSDGHGSVESMYGDTHGASTALMSAISTATMDEVRSRALSDASTHLQLQQQHQQQRQQQQQQQMLYDHHNQQQNGWGSGP